LSLFNFFDDAFPKHVRAHLLQVNLRRLKQLTVWLVNCASCNATWS